MPTRDRSYGHTEQYSSIFNIRFPIVKLTDKENYYSRGKLFSGVFLTPPFRVRGGRTSEVEIVSATEEASSQIIFALLSY